MPLKPEQLRIYQANRSIESSKRLNNMDALPPVANPERKELCRDNLLLYLQAYYPFSTGSGPFSAKHIEFIDDLQDAIQNGGRVARAVFRGFAKTTIGELACIWAVSYGWKKFVPLVGADAGAGTRNLISIQTELSSNDLLLEDFPEICYPIRQLEGRPQRCGTQTFQGELTHIKFTADRLILPMIPGSDASGACILTSSIMGFNRGLKHKIPGGADVRPDFVFIDDPQTNASAATDAQVEKREFQLNTAILKSAGHAVPMSAFVAGTIIRAGDMMDRLTDPEISPSWRAVRVPMVVSWAKEHEEMWLGQYAAIRRDFDRSVPGDQLRAAKRAKAFYEENRAAMDDGCEVTWHNCYSAALEEVSAIQHAYNLLIDDGERAFASECQNEPLVERGDLEVPESKDIAAKISPWGRGIVPDKCEHLTAFVDVQQSVLYWLVAAWAENGTGYVVDYGVWPEQRSGSLRLQDARKTLKKKYASSDQNAVTLQALEDLWRSRIAVKYATSSGGSVHCSLAAVDANWHESAEAVRQFCQMAKGSFKVFPSLGRGISAIQAPMSEWKKRAGERRGDGWFLRKSTESRGRTLLIDVNQWKTRFVRAVALPRGATGGIELYNAPREQHRQLSEQWTSEIPKQVEGGGRLVYQWQCRPGEDNHLFDCAVGCMALADVCGVTRPGLNSKPSSRTKRSRRVRYAS